jgi:dihydroneopterin aldolase
MNNKNLHSSLILQNLAIEVRIGHTAAEREKAQTLQIDLTIQFTQLPLACQTDKLNDTICYDKLVNNIKTFCRNKTFALLEHLAYQLYKFIKNIIRENVKLNLQIKKQPPIENLSNSIFTISDVKEDNL